MARFQKRLKFAIALLKVCLTSTYIRKAVTFLLLDDSALSLSTNQRRILPAALTAKKVILNLLFDPSTPAMSTWMSYLLDIALLECTTAKVHGATERTIQ